MIELEKRAGSLLQLGLDEAYKKNYDSAIKHIEEAQKLFLEVRDVQNIAICLAELALTHYQNNNDRLIRSLTLLNDARALLFNQPNRAEIEAKILHYYGIIYYSEKRYSEALKYFRNAQRLVDKSGIEFARILDDLAIFYLRLNNYQVAVKYLKDALKSKEKIQDNRELSTTKLIYGRHLSNVENYDEAITYLSDALQIIESMGDNATAARVQDELAKIYLVQNDFNSAEELCHKSIQIGKNTNKPLVVAFSSCTLANIRLNQDKYEEAISIIENDAKPVFMDLISVRGYAIAKRIKALAFHKLGQYKEAVEKLHESIELFKEAGANAEIARTYCELGGVYRKSGEISMALSCLHESLKIAKANNLPILAKKIEDFIFELDEEDWANIVNKSALKGLALAEAKPLIDTMALIGDISQPEIKSKDPLLSFLRIGRSIAAETDLDKLLMIIAEETKIALNSDRCTVFLLDKSTNELWSKVALGMGRQEIRFPSHLGLAGHVATTGETINIKDAYNDPRFNKEIDKKTGYKTQTILCMPMRNLNHEIVGVFQVLNKLDSGIFTDSDEDLLIAIGSSAGIALENASLFKKQQQMYEELKHSFSSSINTLAAAIDARDKITSGHSTRVTGYSLAIAKQMEMTKDEVDVLEYAALLHDFGKIGIKDSVLCKEGKLTDEEYKHIQQHAYLTNEILKNMYFEDKYKDVPEIASSHHEKFNGTGYFRGAAGENIPLGGRILAVADVFDAITSKRHYRDRMPIVQVLNILKKDSGSHFDGMIVDYFFHITIDKVLKVLLSKYDASPFTVAETLFFQKYTMDDLHKALLKDEAERSQDEKKLITIFDRHYNPQYEEENIL